MSNGCCMSFFGIFFTRMPPTSCLMAATPIEVDPSLAVTANISMLLAGIGLMGALEVVSDKATKEPFDGSLSVSERLANACLDNGLICRPLGQAIVLCPPYIFDKALTDEMFDKITLALNDVQAGLGR